MSGRIAREAGKNGGETEAAFFILAFLGPRGRRPRPCGRSLAPWGRAHAGGLRIEVWKYARVVVVLRVHPCILPIGHESG